MEDMGEVAGNDDEVADYQREIQDLRLQIQQLQDAGNVKDYPGKGIALGFVLKGTLTYM